MNLEVGLLKEYNSFIKANSVFKDKLLVLPDTPQSFSNFPTIIFKEANNSDSTDIPDFHMLFIRTSGKESYQKVWLFF